MKSRKLFAGALAVLVFAATLSVVLFVQIEPAQAAPCRCPLLYGPVKCDNGKVYPNPCVAACHNGRNCVPTGEL